MGRKLGTGEGTKDGMKEGRNVGDPGVGVGGAVYVGSGDGLNEGEVGDGVGAAVGMFEIMVINPLPDHTFCWFCRIVQVMLLQ